MSQFPIAQSAPATWNPLFNNQNNGGLSWCINGNPTNPTNNVLANCVGWACGRFNQIYNIIKKTSGIKYPQLCCNAEDFWTVAPTLGLKRGQTPKAGAIMCWQGDGDLAGHVCIVERVDSATQVYTSESGWQSAYFWNATRYKADGNWGCGYGYKFLGFIYNPACSGKNPQKTITYRVYDTVKKKWLGVVSTGKASKTNHRIGGIAIKPSAGKVAYCVHNLKGKWLPPVNGYNPNNYQKGFAGEYKPIDGFAIYGAGIKLAYRVKTEKNGWLEWVSSDKYDLTNPITGYAGILGDAITNIEIKVK